MSYPIITIKISSSTFVMLRDRTRQVGELFGLDKLQCTRFITAVSEIARNAVQFADGGVVAFQFDLGHGPQSVQQVIGVVSDNGPGIRDVDAALEGRVNSKGKVPLGLVGSKRLVDGFSVSCPERGGTVVTMQMALPRAAKRLTRDDLGKLVNELARSKGKTPFEELEKQNREMLDTLEELRQRQLQLETADERKNQFLATLAHELRNPLATLRMMLEIIRRDQHMSVSELAQRRDTMERQTDQLSRLVEDLMDVSRVSQGKVQLIKAGVEVNQLVGQALEMSSAAIAGKSHQVHFTPNSDPLWITGDASRLKQVLCNLIQNAARYTPQGGSISISVIQQETSAYIEVADNGVGIQAELLPSVFDLFVQSDSNSQDGRMGLGVGLTLVRGLVHGHGGKVIAQSAGLGKGSQFGVSLPLS